MAPRPVPGSRPVLLVVGGVEPRHVVVPLRRTLPLPPPSAGDRAQAR